ncbi:MAG: hypothetical protein KME38_06105 [Spirirestis rafaelensis WJT71-NPBG6]|jgi:hypothetical protein|nr:hypothetical protein [Spirirestis rafaelensis WJT71-NPBG6]
MPAVDLQSQNSFPYPPSTVERAERSLVCSPFNLCLFVTMRHQSVPVGAIALDSGVKSAYTKRPLSELTCDNALDWLIQVGILRREVDGQGITDSFRLTPLGRQVVEKLQQNPSRSASWRDRLYDSLIRWFRLPF